MVMRFTLSHAALHVCIFVGAVIVFINAGGTAAAPPPPSSPDGLEGNGGSSSGSSSSTNLVTVMTNNHEPIELYINKNGDLAYTDLNEKIEVNQALALSDVNAKCFFWQRFKRGSYNLDFATTVFTATGTHDLLMEEGETGLEFQDAERVYCYDGSRDSIDGTGTFTLLVEPGDESVEKVKTIPTGSNAPDQLVSDLIRIKVGQDDDFAEIPLNISASAIGNLLGNDRNLRVKLLDWPVKGGSNYFDYIDDELQGSAYEREMDPGCYFLQSDGVSAGFLGAPALRDFTKTDSAKSFTLSPVDEIDRIVCFRDHTNPRMRRTWRQARSQEGQQA